MRVGWADTRLVEFTEILFELIYPGGFGGCCVGGIRIAALVIVRVHLHGHPDLSHVGRADDHIGCLPHSLRHHGADGGQSDDDRDRHEDLD